MPSRTWFATTARTTTPSTLRTCRWLGSPDGEHGRALAEQSLPPRVGEHRHREEDELFYVIEGRLALHQPEQRVELGAGGSFFLERGVPHTYEVLGSDQARFLVLAMPSGFDDFVRDVARPAEALSLPDPGEPDPERMAAVAARYGIELLRPPGMLP